MNLSPIKRTRMELGLNQWEVAQLLGVSESYLSRIERGRVRASRKLLSKLRKILRDASRHGCNRPAVAQGSSRKGADND